MSTDITTTNQVDATAIEAAVMGDLSRLTPQQRVSYYNSVCNSLGLNPLTKPFDYISLNGRLTLYARKDATDQLRRIHCVSILDVDVRETESDFIVTARGQTPDGRQDVEIGVVSKKDMRGDYGNGLMKAVTKAKRRLTLSMCGLGWLDETEVETIPQARAVIVEEDGSIDNTEQPAPAQHSKSVTIESMTARYEELATEARAIGIDPEDITGYDLDEIIKAGKALAAEIKAVRS